MRFDVEVEQTHSLAGERVDARSGCAAKDPAAIDAQLAVTQIVHEDNDNVGLLGLLRGSRYARNDQGDDRSYRTEPNAFVYVHSLTSLLAIRCISLSTLRIHRGKTPKIAQ